MGCTTKQYQKLSECNANLQQEIMVLKSMLASKIKTIHELQEKIVLLRYHQYGRKTEALSGLPRQLSLFDDAADDITEQVEAIDAKTEQVTYTRKKRKTKGRKIDTSHLPREVVMHDLSEEEKKCGCGKCLTKIGEDRSECLEFIPAVIKVVEHVRIKYTCRNCESIKMGPKPVKALAKSMAGNSLIVDILIKKYAHHLPLYRQSKILAKLDIDIPDNTMGNWVMNAATLLAPLGEALCAELPNVRLLQVDETTVQVIKPHKKGYMWVYQSLDPGNKFIFFEFSLGRSGDVPKKRLLDFSGIMQTDGYSGYNHFRDSKEVTTLGCWDHARRKFIDAVKVANNNANGLAGQFIKLMGKLYKVEAEHKESITNERYAARQQLSVPILNDIFALAKRSNALPKSLLGKAIGYLLNNEPDLKAYANYGDTQLTNILTENQIRPFAIGRRNWLFVGTESSANKSALVYSLIQSCELNSINPRKYLSYIFKIIHDIRCGKVDVRSILPQFIDKSLL